MQIAGQHGNAKKIEEYREKAERAAEEYDEGEESIYNAVANYYKRTFKNTLFTTVTDWTVPFGIQRKDTKTPDILL